MKGVCEMRITTQMLNESARKAGLPINNTSLLNYINSDGKQNTLLDALNKNKETSIKKDGYEKIDKEADQLMQAANNLLQDGENSLFEQAKTSGDYQKIYDSIESLFEKYNGTLKALKATTNTMNDFYREMMLEASAETKTSLSDVGITFAKDGTARVDMERVKATDFETLEGLFGTQSDYVNKIGFLSEKVSNNAEANIRSLNSTYNASGNLYTAIGNSKYDFWS